MNYIFDKKMKIHDKIRTFRQAKGFTQDYVADKLNLDAANYGRIERGHAKITVERLTQLSEILQFNIADLFSNSNITQENENYLQKIYETVTKIHEELKDIKTKIY
jgi:transcriptional regulator with XRE-family HTH domain